MTGLNAADEKIYISDEELAKNYANGDMSAGSELVERYMPLIRSMLYNNPVSGKESDDLLQELLIKFLDVVKTYEPGKGAKLTTYVKTCISNKIVDEIRRADKGQRGFDRMVMSLDAPVGENFSDDESKNTMSQLVSDDTYNPEENVVGDISGRENIGKLEGKLSKRETVVLDYIFKGYDAAEIAQFLDCDVTSVVNTRERIKSKIRKFCV